MGQLPGIGAVVWLTNVITFALWYWDLDADQPHIPVGIDGESVLMPTPVRCTIHPLALRVRVPRDRPGVPDPRPAMDWSRLRRQALMFTATSGGSSGAH